MKLFLFAFVGFLSAGFGMGEEVERLIRKFPHWVHGSQTGQYIAFQFLKNHFLSQGGHYLSYFIASINYYRSIGPGWQYPAYHGIYC